ncbi:MAG: hypothetical protein UFA98_08355 [Ruminococcus sp.]|nr:hypothetical protein [Ruminococcus sp.]
MFIIVRKGSTFFGRIELTDRDQNVVLLEETDKLIFTVRKGYYSEEEGNPLIKKVITPDREIEGGYCFELTPEETDLNPGTYYYDIGVQCENGEFYHIDMIDEFIINPSVSRNED